MKTTKQMLAESRQRAFLNRCKTPTKVFIGGLVIGIISHDIFIHILPYIDMALDVFSNYLINLLK
jgi:hypothetical protein